MALNILNGIQKIIDLLEGATGGLPEVNNDDNGKVLTVVDGEWDAAEPSSLPEAPSEDGTYNLQANVSSGVASYSWASGGGSGGGAKITASIGAGGIELDASYNDIATLIDNGIDPVILMSNGTGTGILRIVQYYQSSLNYYVDAFTATLNNGNVVNQIITFSAATDNDNLVYSM